MWLWGTRRGAAPAQHPKWWRALQGRREHHGYGCQPENKNLWAEQKEHPVLFIYFPHPAPALLQFNFHIYLFVKWKKYKSVIWLDEGSNISLWYTGKEKVSLNWLTLCRVAFPHPLPVYRQCPCNESCLHRTKICICTTYLLITIASSARWSPSPGINSNMSSLWYLFFKMGLPRMLFSLCSVCDVTYQTYKFECWAHASHTRTLSYNFCERLGLFLQYIFCKTGWYSYYNLYRMILKKT